MTKVIKFQGNDPRAEITFEVQVDPAKITIGVEEQLASTALVLVGAIFEAPLEEQGQLARRLKCRS